VTVVAYTNYFLDGRVRFEAEGLAESGCEVHVIAARSEQPNSATVLNEVVIEESPLQVRRGGKMRYLFQYFAFLLTSSAMLLRSSFGRRSAILHIHSLPDFQVLCALPFKLLGAAVVLDMHESMPELILARFGVTHRSLWFKLALATQKLSALLADHVIVACDGIKNLLVERGVPVERVTSISNVADSPVTRLPDAEVRKLLSIPPGRMIVHVGGVNAERDLDTLIRAVATIAEKDIPLLVIAGPGQPSYVNMLRALATELRVDSRIQFVGQVSLDLAQSLVSMSEFGVVTLLSNPHTELSWPTRIGEFAAAEKPLVVPTLSFIRSALGEGARYYSPGDHVSLANAIRAVMTDEKTNELMTRRAKEVCKAQSWDAVRSSLLRLINSVGLSPGVLSGESNSDNFKGLT